MLKKATNSEGMILVSDLKATEKFPPGFSYIIKDVIYTVQEIVTKDPNAEMRRLTTSSGATEDLTTASIVKDLKVPGCKILSEGVILSQKQEKKAEKSQITEEQLKEKQDELKVKEENLKIKEAELKVKELILQKKEEKWKLTSS